MRSASATAPLHITGLFEPVYHRDWRRTGSRGAGLALLPGVETTVLPARRTRVYLDGRPVAERGGGERRRWPGRPVAERGGGERRRWPGRPSRAPTTRRVVELLAPGPVEVRTRLPAPAGAGLGTSGAGALSTARAIDRAFGLRLPPRDLVAAAHRAEVENRTGLGTVAGVAGGGLTLRLAPGIGSGALRSFPIPARIAWVVLGGLSTPRILSDPAWNRIIRREGRRSLRGLLRRPTLRRFMEESRRFALETGLAQGRTLDALEAVEGAGGLGSVAMLGRTLFAVSTPAVREALSEFGPVRESRISPVYSILRPLGKQRA
ncbi:MAG: GHMP kinase [Halobacteria archaeon]